MYFTVFGAGAAYLLRMMGRLPAAQELEPPHIPQRAAGITPASGIDTSSGRATLRQGEVSRELQPRPERRLGADHRLRDSAYVVMDGFDLGIGILFPTLAVGPERDQAMNSIAPVWDGNETWLILGGGGLMAAFPLAYSIILPATYPLIIAMLLGLVFRGVAFEFRWRDPEHRPYWDAAFALGSFVAASAQGITLGAILQGIRVVNDGYGGGWLDWLSPFSILTGSRWYSATRCSAAPGSSGRPRAAGKRMRGGWRSSSGSAPWPR